MPSCHELYLQFKNYSILKAILLFPLLLLGSLYAYGQGCATIDVADPNFSPARFQQFQQQVASQKRSGIVYLPIQAHIVTRSDSTGGLSLTALNDEMELVNSFYINAGIQFSFCSAPIYMYDDSLYDYQADTEEQQFIDARVDDVINIFFTERVLSRSGNAACGYAYFPWSNNDLIVMDNSCSTNGSTLAHELGHYFGVYHTHSFGDELADGSNCDLAGDLLCDTPADPNLSGEVTNFCTYDGTDLDDNGDPYNPDVSNVMSYSRKVCRNTFTQGQYDLISFYNADLRDYLICTGTQNDDHFLTNTSISFDTVTAGDAITISADYNLVSDGPFQKDVSMGILLSSDHTVDGGDLLLANKTSLLDTFAPLTTFSSIYTIPVTVQSGVSYLLLNADHLNNYAETDESNNLIFFEIFIKEACVASITNTSLEFGPGEETLSTGLSTSLADCDWLAEADCNWLNITPTNGAGDGNITITAAANSSGIDRSCTAIIGNNTYQVTQRGFATSVDEPTFAESLKLYPQPTSDMLVIELPNDAQGYTLALHDLSGKLVLNNQTTGNTTLDLGNLQSGIYLLKVQNDTGVVIRKVMVD